MAAREAAVGPAPFTLSAKVSGRINDDSAGTYAIDAELGTVIHRVSRQCAQQVICDRECLQ